MTPDIADGGTIDATKPFEITVEAYGRLDSMDRLRRPR